MLERTHAQNTQTLLSSRIPRDTEHERYHPELEEELKECLFCLRRNEMMFDLEVDTDLIEQRIYERQALLCRYRYLLARARELGLRNVFFVDIDVARIEECFAPGELDGMFINFCDPWPRKKNAKRRLTHRGFLEKYSRVLTPGGQIHFKTDNAPLLQFSLEEFQALDFPLQGVTWNLHENGPVGIMTDYEEKFYAQGTPIHRCEVTLHPIEATEPAYEKSEDRENSAEETGED